jgi:hypothetical protein
MAMFSDPAKWSAKWQNLEIRKIALTTLAGSPRSVPYLGGEHSLTSRPFIGDCDLSNELLNVANKRETTELRPA